MTHPKITEALQSAFNSIRIWRMDKRDARLMEVDTLGGIRERVRADLDEVREELAGPTSEERYAALVAEDYTLASIQASLTVANMRGQSCPASQKQLDYLASLAHKAGDSASGFTGMTLTSGSVSRLINDYLKD